MSKPKKSSSAIPAGTSDVPGAVGHALAAALAVPGVFLNERPETVAGQGWQRVRYWRKRLENTDPAAVTRAGQSSLSVFAPGDGDEDANPALARLEQAWRNQQVSSEDSAALDWPGRALERPMAPLLDHALEWVRRGLYPPPELLIVLLEQHSVYLEARGRLGLEDVFYGPAAKRAGNYAARRDKEVHRREMVAQFDALVAEGKSKTMAAEMVMEANGIDRYANDFLKELSRWRRRLCDGK